MKGANVISSAVVASVLFEIRKMEKDKGATVESVKGSRFGHIASDAIRILKNVGAISVNEATGCISVSEKFAICKDPRLSFMEECGEEGTPSSQAAAGAAIIIRECCLR